MPPPEVVGVSDAPGQACTEKTFHDFRSSMNIIIGYSELMLDETLGKITDEQRDGIKEILTSSRHLLDIVNDMSRWQAPSRLLRR